MRLPLLAALAVVLAACQGDASYAPEPTAESLTLDEAPERSVSADVAPRLQPVQDTSRRAPILLRTADLTFRVGDYPEAAAAVPRIVGQFDAYLAGEEENRSSYRVSNTYTIRVASVQFDSLLTALTALADDVEHRSISVTDVTEEFVDVEARLRARRAVEAQYVALLERAADVEDVVAVQEKLAQVREEIERAEGRLRYLRDRAAMSTVRLTLFEESPTGIASGPGFFDRLGDAFADGWDVFLGLLVGMVALWPLWLIVGLAIWGWRVWRRRHPGALRRTSRRPTPRRPEAPPPD